APAAGGRRRRSRRGRDQRGRRGRRRRVGGSAENSPGRPRDFTRFAAVRPSHGRCTSGATMWMVVLVVMVVALAVPVTLPRVAVGVGCAGVVASSLWLPIHADFFALSYAVLWLALAGITLWTKGRLAT